MTQPLPLNPAYRPGFSVALSQAYTLYCDMFPELSREALADEYARLARHLESYFPTWNACPLYLALRKAGASSVSPTYSVFTVNGATGEYTNQVATTNIDTAIACWATCMRTTDLLTNGIEVRCNGVAVQY